MFYVKNVPVWERIARVIVGIAVAVLSIAFWTGAVGIIVAIAALGIVVSGLVGFCPACALVGRRLQKAQIRAQAKG
ncbi:MULTISPECIES: YgaP family membrane protein [Paraburkholderia]|jgi:hypothetical protein|uniref:Inner membrane protein YgaP-like transmembrane domain-containing protein n=1 Tax=Paraburkholderia largidicola TaxID=3014751 RepID=A0A7I8BHD3_9BURK|nr:MULTISPECIES: DUF2892 domain-containing protein [Paraburkholderia]BCF88037.1 hypothetical protein PPGU16_11040 [Paraburkholderia sp. PGU16]GJH00763.1 DUF2892 domain-containing protein [Paraburkholderia terrae]GJH34584.1 DUF2892 domain-containing protein [Paraburkholderia hospita]CAG9266571.1 conserved hypothetical protein [Paraburkholderia caribensis]